MSSTSNNSSRSVAESNINLSFNEFIEGSRSPNSKKLENQVINLFNATMEALNKSENTNSYKKLHETTIEELPSRLCKFFMCCLKENGQVFNASSLNTYYRVMIRYLKFRDSDPIDISVDVNFTKVGPKFKSI